MRDEENKRNESLAKSYYEEANEKKKRIITAQFSRYPSPSHMRGQKQNHRRESVWVRKGEGGGEGVNKTKYLILRKSKQLLPQPVPILPLPLGPQERHDLLTPPQEGVPVAPDGVGRVGELHHLGVPRVPGVLGGLDFFVGRLEGEWREWGSCFFLCRHCFCWLVVLLSCCLVLGIILFKGSGLSWW